MTIRVTITHDEPMNPREIYVGERMGVNQPNAWLKVEPGTSVSLYVYHTKDIIISESLPEHG